MKLQSLKLRNFKKLREFTLEPNGEDISVFGDNAVGKTTLKDGFLWVLFDKNSKNQKVFEIKTIGPDKQPLHYLDHEVEMVLALGDRTVTLRKVYAEKYRKKRGSAKEEFDGHTTSYYIDGVPMQLNQYKDAIDQIAGREETFRLLTDPGYFIGTLKWQDRRKILLEACGNVSDADVISSDIRLAGLPAILGNRSLDDQKKVIAAQRTKINEELKMIPARIDEANRALPETNGMNPETIQATLAALRAKRQETEWTLNMVNSGGGIAEKTNELRKVEARIQELENEHQKAVNAADQGTDKKLRELNNQIATLNDTMARLTKQIDRDDREAVTLSSDRLELLATYHEAEALTFEFKGSDTCPTCGQSLPETQVEAARVKALAAFNRDKAQTLEKIKAQGSVKTSTIAKLKEEIATLEHERDAALEKVESLEHERDNIPTQEKVDIPYPAEYTEALNKKAEIQNAIAGLKAGNTQETNRIKDDLAAINQQIAVEEKGLAQFTARENTLKRIAELGQQQKKFAAEFEELERQLFLCELFIRAKVGMLTDQINSRFACTQWKLFEEQLNGGLAECCVALGQDKDTGAWVPYDTDLNGGGRMNVGLDCINTLSEFYEIDCPIWIDEAGEVTRILPTKGQQIRLYVSEADKVLRVETAREKVGAA